MTNPPDVDQSGNPLPREPTYLGPTVGWVLQYSPLGLPDLKYYTYYAPTIAGAAAVLGAGTLYIPGTDNPVLPATFSGITLEYDGPAIPFTFGQGPVTMVADRLTRSQHAGPHSLTYYTAAIETESVGSGVHGPEIMDVGFGVNHWKKNWSDTANRQTLPVGELDGIDIYMRNSGPTSNGATNSDTSAYGYNIVNIGDCGFVTGLEGVSYSFNDDLTIHQGIDIQIGGILRTSLVNLANGFVANPIFGSCGAAYLAQNDTGTWAYAFQVGATSLLISMDGSMVLNNAPGGNKGAGTINARGVYDDGVILTCPALAQEFIEHGKIDLAKWDAFVPDLIIPAYKKKVAADESERTAADYEIFYREVGEKVFKETVRDRRGQLVEVAHGYMEGVDATPMPISKEVDVPEERTLRTHTTARLFKAMVDEGFDPRDPTQYIAKLKRDEALPGMPTQKDWEHNALSMGEMHSRLWLATEMLALVVIKQQERLDAIEAKLGI